LGTFFCDTCCITPLVELLSELKVIWAGGQWTQAQARVWNRTWTWAHDPPFLWLKMHQFPHWIIFDTKSNLMGGGTDGPESKLRFQIGPKLEFKSLFLCDSCCIVPHVELAWWGGEMDLFILFYDLDFIVPPLAKLLSMPRVVWLGGGDDGPKLMFGSFFSLFLWPMVHPPPPLPMPNYFQHWK
jgi:hypothetical protein